MTNEEKQLLLIDLCGRLPYGIRYKGDGGWGINPYQHTTSLSTIINSEEPLIYLRPMSSMTDEEQKYRTELIKDIKHGANIDKLEDFYHSRHLDYRGLIEKGLALEAPEGMYKI